MPRTLKDLSRFVEEEARKEGAAATEELEALRMRYRLAREIAERREHLHLTQQALARLSGVRQSEISKIESGRANPTVDTLFALLLPLGGALGVMDLSSSGPAPRKGTGKRRRTPSVEQR